MLQLTRHELYKLFTSKGIGVALILCLLVYGMFAYSEKPPAFNNYHNVYSYYKEWQGPVSSSGLTAVIEGKKRLKIKYDQGIRYSDKELAESLLYRDIENVEKESARYKTRIQSLNSKSDKVSRLQQSMLEKVGPLQGAYYMEGWRAVFESGGKIGGYLAILLGVFNLSKIFPDEKAAGMHILIGSTKEGRRKLVLAKLAAALVFVSLGTAVFALVDLLINTFFYGIAGWDVLLKNLFFQTGYDYQLWQFWMLKLLIEILVVSIFGMLAVLASILTRNGIGGIIAAGLVFIVHFKATAAVQAQGLGSLLVTDFCKLRQFGVSYQHTYMMAGVAVTYECMLLAVCVLLLIVLLLAVYFSGGRYGTD